MHAPDVEPALARARAAAREGQWESAEALYAALADESGCRLEAVAFLAHRRFVQQRYAESCRYAEQALALDPSDRSRMHLARSLFGAGDRAGVERVLSQLRDPDFGNAALLRGALQHERGEHRAALASFETCLRRQAGVGDRARLPPLLAELFALATQVCADSLRSTHRRILDELAGSCGDEPLHRIRRAIEHYHDRTGSWQHELQRPSFFYVPGLPAEPWFERHDFPWIEAFERATDAIRDEYRRFVAARSQSLTPYITSEQNAPRSTWGHLIDTENWLSLHLLKGGARVDPNASEMPATMAALQATDLPVCAGNCPEAFFSTLAPGTHIPPHYGLANFKLTAHLALDVPDDCAIRVGGQTRHWVPGQCLFFDDSFLHEAWNRSSRPRTVLIFDVWHPGLTAIERTALRRVFEPIDAAFNFRLSELGSAASDG